MGHTVAEKILARKAGEEEVSPGDHVICDVDFVMTNDLGTLGALDQFEQMDVERVWNPSAIGIVMDHVAPSHSVDDANSKSRIREFVRNQGIEHFYDVGTGIGHEVIPEQGHIRPGELIIGSDSHTTSIGAFGAAGVGIGFTDIAYVFATGQSWFRVPNTIKFHIDGHFPNAVSAKDIVLYIAGTYGTDIANYRAIEYDGPAVKALPLDQRFTLANMAVDLGGKFGFTPVDEEVTHFIADRTDQPYQLQTADTDAMYENSYTIDATELEPQVAKPHDVNNVVPVQDVEGIDIDQVFVGSCTNGTIQDLRRTAEYLDGQSVAESTRMIVTPASREISLQAEEEGLIREFLNAGAVVTNPTCGACIGMGMGVLGDGEVCLAAQNRNFKGRMGSDSAKIYLSSPETAAASAIAGRITDPRREN